MEQISICLERFHVIFTNYHEGQRKKQKYHERTLILVLIREKY